MTDPFVRDDILEAVLRARAGDRAPGDLHGEILAAVAADGPRATVRRSVGHPWRLLAVAAVLLGTVGTALFVGGVRVSQLTPSPGPSLLAVTNPSPPATASTADATPVASPTDPCAGLGPIARHAGATLGGWTPGPEPDPTATVSNGVVAAVPYGPIEHQPVDDDIRLLDVANGSARKVTDFGAFDTLEQVLGWSPSGRNLAYLTTDDTSHCMDLFIWSEDGLVQALGSSTLWWQQPIGWAPDESSIAVVSQTAIGVSSLGILPADGSVVRDLGVICPSCYFFGGPMWSPDGSRIAISGANDQGQTVMSRIIDPSDGSSSELPGLPGVDRWLDNETLLVDPAGDGPLATMTVPTGSAPAGDAVTVAWPPATMEASPDLAYALDWRTCGGSLKTACGVTVRDEVTGKDRVVWSRTGVNLIAFWAPDSRSIIVNVHEGPASDIGIWTVGVDGSNPKRIYDTPVAHDWPIAWQPVWP
jgi:hypothetical protein